MELISVIMSCYNAASFLEEAVMRVVNQTYSKVELIVVDDGTTDQSAEILQQLIQNHPNRIKYLQQHREGPYVARNRGLEAADGTCIAFLDVDDWWREDFIGKQHSALAGNAAAALVYPVANSVTFRAPQKHGDKARLAGNIQILARVATP